MIDEPKDDIESLKRRLYSYNKQYNKFKNINDEKINSIKKKINTLFKDNNKRYLKILKHLTDNLWHSEFSNYDERILFLILAVDPELYIYKKFIYSNIVSKITIENTNDEAEKNYLKEKRKEQLKKYVKDIKNKFGFFDYNLLIYEKDVIKILEQEKLDSNVKIDSINMLLKNSNLIKDYDSIDEESIERLNMASKIWQNEAENPYDYNSLAYNIIAKPYLLNLKSYKEQVLLFIMIADPDLKLLDIYEEESKYDIIEKRSKNELGFYNQNLIQLEKKYHKKFTPNKKIKFLSK